MVCQNQDSPGSTGPPTRIFERGLESATLVEDLQQVEAMQERDEARAVLTAPHSFEGDEDRDYCHQHRQDGIC